MLNENINLLNMENDIKLCLDDYYYNNSFDRVISKNLILNSVLNNFKDIKIINMVTPEEDIIPGIGEVIDVVDIRVEGSYYV